MVAHDDRVQAAPTGVGIGLRTPHVAEILATCPAAAFLEVHPENYFGGGPAVAALERLRRDYPLSLHGVGLSLGGSDALDTRHLARLAGLVERLDPVFVSEHLAWSVVDGVYLNHLLPLPYDEESLDTMCSRVDQAQQDTELVIAGVDRSPPTCPSSGSRYWSPTVTTTGWCPPRTPSTSTAACRTANSSSTPTPDTAASSSSTDSS
jgi:hypothetical protein